MKNKKGQYGGLMFSIVTALMLFMVGMLMVNILRPEIDQARIDNSCTAPTSDGNRVLCLMFDLTMSYWFILILSATGGIIVDRFLV